MCKYLLQHSNKNQQEQDDGYSSITRNLFDTSGSENEEVTVWLPEITSATILKQSNELNLNCSMLKENITKFRLFRKSYVYLQAGPRCHSGALIRLTWFQRLLFN